LSAGELSVDSEYCILAPYCGISWLCGESWRWVGQRH